MSPTLRVRKAREQDVPETTRISLEAFRGRPMNEAMFPAHLRADPAGEAARQRMVAERRLAALAKPHAHVIVVVDDGGGGGGGERVLASAEWQSAPEPVVPDLTPEQRAARDAGLPGCVDPEALALLEGEIVLLDRTVRDALGDDGYDNSWYLAGISVDPAHHRKGIGRMLVEWGEELAFKEHKNVRLLASLAGSKLYRAMGYEEVGAREICGGMEYAFIKRAQ